MTEKYSFFPTIKTDKIESSTCSEGTEIIPILKHTITDADGKLDYNLTTGDVSVYHAGSDTWKTFSTNTGSDTWELLTGYIHNKDSMNVYIDAVSTLNVELIHARTNDLYITTGTTGKIYLKAPKFISPVLSSPGVILTARDGLPLSVTGQKLEMLIGQPNGTQGALMGYYHNSTTDDNCYAYFGIKTVANGIKIIQVFGDGTVVNPALATSYMDKLSNKLGNNLVVVPNGLGLFEIQEKMIIDEISERTSGSGVTLGSTIYTKKISENGPGNGLDLIGTVHINTLQSFDNTYLGVLNKDMEFKSWGTGLFIMTTPAAQTSSASVLTINRAGLASGNNMDIKLKTGTDDFGSYGYHYSSVLNGSYLYTSLSSSATMLQNATVFTTKLYSNGTFEVPNTISTPVGVNLVLAPGTGGTVILGSTMSVDTINEYTSTNGVKIGTSAGSYDLLVNRISAWNAGTNGDLSLSSKGTGKITLNSGITASGKAFEFITGLLSTATYSDLTFGFSESLSGYLRYYYDSGTAANRYIGIGYQGITESIKITNTGATQIATLYTNTISSYVTGIPTDIDLNIETAGNGLIIFNCTNKVDSIGIAAIQSTIADTKYFDTIFGKDTTTNYGYLRYYKDGETLNHLSYIGFGYQGYTPAIKAYSDGTTSVVMSSAEFDTIKINHVQEKTLAHGISVENETTISKSVVSGNFSALSIYNTSAADGSFVTLNYGTDLIHEYRILYERNDTTVSSFSIESQFATDSSAIRLNTNGFIQIIAQVSTPTNAQIYMNCNRSTGYSYKFISTSGTKMMFGTDEAFASSLLYHYDGVTPANNYSSFGFDGESNSCIKMFKGGINQGWFNEISEATTAANITFKNNVKVDNVGAKTTNGSLTLGPNGTGNVVINAGSGVDVNDYQFLKSGLTATHAMSMIVGTGTTYAGSMKYHYESGTDTDSYFGIKHYGETDNAIELHKGGVSTAKLGSIYTDNLYEKTGSNGVKVNQQLKVDSISALSSNTALTIAPTGSGAIIMNTGTTNEGQNIRVLMSSLGTGHSFDFIVGKSTTECGYIRYYYDSVTPANSYMALGYYGVDPIIKIFASSSFASLTKNVNSETKPFLYENEIKTLGHEITELKDDNKILRSTIKNQELERKGFIERLSKLEDVVKKITGNK